MTIGDKLVLKKTDTGRFFESLGQEMRLIAPKAAFGGDVMFDVAQSPDEIVWDYGHDVCPPKQFVFPQTEEMLRYEANGKANIKNLLDAPKQAIIGIRSCDVSGIKTLDGFFGSDIIDPYFKARAENTVLFSLVCNTPPKEECFCICCDAGPFLDGGFDVQLTDLGDRFLYEIGSEKGLAATEPRSDALRAAEAADVQERKRIELQADSQFQTKTYFAKAIIPISSDLVPDEVWEEMASTCLRCGACTNLCPVCTCFTVEDRAQSGESFLRCRSWDSCQYAGFTREASGFNPRHTAGSRLKRRFYHKASYQYIARDGHHGCVGCGRCVTACLTHLGAPDVVKRIRREMHKYLEPEAV